MGFTRKARGTFLACMLVACRFQPDPVSGEPDGSGPDGPMPPDGMVVGPDGDAPRPDAGTGCVSWPATNLELCSGLTSGGTLDLSFSGTYVFDTGLPGITAGPSNPVVTVGVVDQAAGPPLVVLLVDDFTLGGSTTLEVVGSRPFVIAAAGSVQIDGSIVVRAGAGDDALCAGGLGVSGEAGMAGPDGGGGGGGGGFGADGNVGGGGNGAGGGGGMGGSANGGTSLSPLRGGCRGAFGGDNVSVAADAAGGAGGGALQITASGSLTVGNGVIDAGGLGGQGGIGGVNAATGGGGGGSGGGIFLEGDVVTVSSSASLCANGGSGGEGGANASRDGASGRAGSCSEGLAATTDDLVSDGGNGGDGGIRQDQTGNAGSASPGNGGGGGGGGGGVGVIRVRSWNAGTVTVDGASTVSPLEVP